MLHCAVLDDYQKVAMDMADWSRLAPSVSVRPVHRHLPPDELASAIGDCEIVVIMRERTPFPASMFARLPKLRLLVTSGRKNAAVDLAAARAHGVTVCSTDSRSEAPAELTWALILGLARKISAEDRSFHEGGPWQSTLGADLQGRTLGLLGLGNIGSRVARVGQAFGMNVLAWSQNLTSERAGALSVGRAESLAVLLKESDFVSIHLKLSDRTRSLMGAAELRQMRPHAFLVNTSRAEIVDQKALLTALGEGWIKGAGLDVFWQEPLAGDDPLRSLPNLLATPHLGYVTETNYRLYYTQSVEDIEAYLKGSPIRVIS